jgi:alkylation response protein AidB-like acyl-CoA dehydrogenase
VVFELEHQHLTVQRTMRDFAQREGAARIREGSRRQAINPAIPRRMGRVGILDVQHPNDAWGLEHGPHRPWPRLRGVGGRATHSAPRCDGPDTCLDASVKHTWQRQTFGRTAVDHQLVLRKIAGVARDCEIADLAYLRAGWRKNVGRRTARDTSLAKWLTAASRPLQVHGACGHSDEHDVRRYLRNARGVMVCERPRRYPQADPGGLRAGNASGCAAVPRSPGSSTAHRSGGGGGALRRRFVVDSLRCRMPVPQSTGRRAT